MAKPWIIAAGLGLVVGIGIAGATMTGLIGLPKAISERVSGQALVGGPFELIDHQGQRVTDQDFRGKHMLVYFGFAHCPDICPSALQLMSAALDELGPEANDIVPVFVSVDPERDTPDVMAQYVSAFHPRLIGLTGSVENVSAAAKAYRVYHRKVADPGSDSSYTVDHSSIIYLMGTDGQFVTHFTHGTPLDAIVERLRSLS